MPRSLLRRCQPDSIREFRAAARQRFDDGLVLSSRGRRTGAIYLWGYTCEMALKAAYFTFQQVSETRTLDWRNDLLAAITRGRNLGLVWPQQGRGHNVRAWAELLVAERATSAATAYSTDFGGAVQRCGLRVEHLWRETLRYRKNRAYLYEVGRMRDAAEWLLVNSHAL